MNSFQELNLPAFLHEALKKMKFEKPTPVQAQAIPVALQGKDVSASAETGSGKTAAFGIPLLAFLEKHRDRTALVLVPTRELADQVRGVLKELACGRHEYDSALLIGGVGMGAQVDSLRRGARLVIGTPGRINDHLQRKTLHLSRAGFLVLDEADRMLDMGFAPQLDRIRQFLTAPRQTLLFSATMPPDMQSMAAKYLTDPVRIAVGANARPVESIRQAILHTSQARKMDDLVEELKTREGSILIFGRTQHRVDRLSKKLKEAGFANARIHGGRTQGQRRIALEEFKEGRARILVATDIAARGLDISHIAHVINFDLPQVAEDYVHRVGRTARAGAEGDSLSLLTPEDRDLWKDVLKTLGSAQATLKTLPSHFKDHPTPQANPERMRAQTPSHPSQSRHGKPQGSHAQGHGRSNHPGGDRHPGHGSGGHQGQPRRDHASREDRSSHRSNANGPHRGAEGKPQGSHPGPRHATPHGGSHRSNDSRGERQHQGDVDGNRAHPSGHPHSNNARSKRPRHGYGNRAPKGNHPSGSSNDSASHTVKDWFKRMF